MSDNARSERLGFRLDGTTKALIERAALASMRPWRCRIKTEQRFSTR